MGIGGKITVAVMVAIFLTAGIGLMIQRSVIRQSGIEQIRANMRGALIEAENVRQSISQLQQDKAFDLPKLQADMQQTSDLRKTALYRTIPVVAGWKAIEELAKQEQYEFRVVKHQARNAKNHPTPDEEKILKTFEDPQVKEYFQLDTKRNRIVYARPIVLTQDCLACHGDPKTSPTGDGKDVVGFAMENWKAGEVHGTFILQSDMERIDKVVRAGMWQTLLWIMPFTLLVAVGFVFINKRMIVIPLKRAMGCLSDGTQQVDSAASQVADAAQQAALNATQQASSVEQTGHHLQQMTQITRENTGHTQQADTLTCQAKEAAEQGNQTVAQLTQAMQGINQSSQEVSQIIKVIQEIAFQTNLLALNAAVEAARAGDAGKGFAVVAEEVRALALRSAKAARDTHQLINQAVEKAHQGNQVSDQVRQSLGTIAQRVDEMARIMHQLNSANERQGQSVHQVNTLVDDMGNITQRNAAGAEETAAAAEQLTAMANSLNEQVSREMLALIHGQAPLSSEKPLNPKDSSRDSTPSAKACPKLAA